MKREALNFKVDNNQEKVRKKNFPEYRVFLFTFTTLPGQYLDNNLN